MTDHWKPTDPEMESIEMFAEYLADDDRDSFTGAELQVLNASTHLPVKTIRRELESYGFTLAGRPKEKRIRTLGDNPHNRWAGNPCAGGSGWSQIAGLAGQEG